MSAPIATGTVTATGPSRRTFLKLSGAAGAGLVIGVHLPLPERASAVRAAPAPTADAGFTPNAFVRVGPDDSITVLIKHIEFGQGPFTGLPVLVAEEMDADWAQMRAEHAPADASTYANLIWASVGMQQQGTGGSTAMAEAFLQMRRAGATARAMLLAAAAEAWAVPVAELTVERGTIRHAASGQATGFGALAERAARQPVPDQVSLKDTKDFVLIGSHVPRIDSREKTIGTAVFTQDLHLPDQLTAVLARPPRFGATVAGFDPAPALAVPGVRHVVETSRGVAVVGTDFWSAETGRRALAVVWDESRAEKRSSADLKTLYRNRAQTPGLPARRDGDPEAALKRAATVVEADYHFPFLAHAPMEPLNAIARLTDTGCEVWTGSQTPTLDQAEAARRLGCDPRDVVIHTLFAGGSFGRRATPDADMVVEAVETAKAIGGTVPVKVVWTREDDIRGGRYRPMMHHALKAGLDGDGRLVAWHQRIVGQSILSGTAFEAVMVHDGIDHTSVEGASTMPYGIPNLGVELHTMEVGVPVLWWRSVGHSHVAYAVETFLDTVAAAAGRDPVAFRMELLGDHDRHKGVLMLAAEKAGWGSPAPAGRARGIAVHKSFGSFVAQVAEVSIATGRPKVHKVVCAVDCGLPVTPDVIRAQMEGGIAYGLGAILHNAITLDDGRVRESNFDGYVPLRIDEMPEIEVHIVPSSADPSGVGEPGVPPIGPAVANAIAALTGRRIRDLPMAQHDFG